MVELRCAASPGPCGPAAVTIALRTLRARIVRARIERGGGRPMDQNLFNDICRQQPRLSGVHEGETVAVLTRGAERGEYADAFLWAAQQLGASTFHLRLPPPA